MNDIEAREASISAELLLEQRKKLLVGGLFLLRELHHRKRDVRLISITANGIDAYVDLVSVFSCTCVTAGHLQLAARAVSINLTQACHYSCRDRGDFNRWVRLSRSRSVLSEWPQTQ